MMRTALFLITHPGIASNLLEIAEAIIKKTSNNLALQEVPMDALPEAMAEEIENKVKELDTTDGIIFITDIYGSTPSNIAQSLADKYAATLISGVNLPMMIRLLNYRNEPENTLIDKAVDGGHKGIQETH